MGAQNVNFVPKFSKIGGFPDQNFAFFDEIFQQEENSPTG